MEWLAAKAVSARKAKRRALRNGLAAVSALAMGAFAPTMTQAATFYFDGGGTTTTGLGWGTAANWSTDLAGTTDPAGSPVSTDDVIFSITGAAAGVVGLNADRAANSLTFSSAVANTLMSHTTTTTSFSLTLGGGGITIDSGAGAVTIGVSTRGTLTTVLGASQSWTNNSSNLFSVIQPVTLGSNTLTLAGSGTGGTTISGAIGGTGGLIVNRSGSGVVTLSGGSNFTGGVTMTAGTASFTSTGLGTGKITFNGNSTLQWGAATTTDLSSRLIINTGVTATLDTGANNVTFASIFGLESNSKGTLKKTGSGTLTLSNVINQFAGNIVITNGKVALGGQFSMWQSAYDTTGSTGAIGLNSTGQVAPWLGGLAGSVDLATAITAYTSITALTLNPQSGSSVSYGGVISNATMTLSKTGLGTQTLTGTNSYGGATTVWAGTLALSGASGSALSSAFTVRGGTVELDNSGGTFINRLADATALSLGSLTLKSYNGAGAQTETVGATTFAVGGKVTINNGTTGGDQTTFAMGAVTRSAGAAIDFVGTNGTLGSGANSPNATSTGAWGGAQNGILPWATVGGTAWGQDNANSIRAYAGAFTAFTGAGATSTTQAQQTGAAAPTGSAIATNSLNVISDGSTNILNLGNNVVSFGNAAGSIAAILKSGTNPYTISASGTGSLRAGTGGAGTELIAHVDGGALTISAPLNTAIVNIAKGGTGDLILSGTRATTMGGNISIAGGQLEFQGAGLTISGVVTGLGGLTVNLNSGQTLTINNNSNSYAGPTIVKGGYFSGGGFPTQGLPGGIGSGGPIPGTNTSQIMSNLVLNGGVIYNTYTFNKDLGAGPGQVQVLAGTSGFVNTANSGGAAGFVLDGGRELVWGSTYFNPTVFVHSINNGNLTLNLANGFDLNGSTRTVLVGDATYNAPNGVSQLGGNIRNSSGTAGLTKTGISTLLLSGTNTYNGATTISSGILRIGNQVSLYNNTPASWTAANIVVANGATLALNVGGAGQFTTGNVTTLLTNLGGANGTSTTGFAAGSFIGFDTTNASPTTFTVADNIADSSGAGGGAIGVVKLGSNTLVLSGASNSYSGATVIRGGTLSLTGSLTGNTAISTADNNNGGGGTVLNGILNQSAAGVISGATASFTQGSSGTSILSGNNSYGGGTTLNAGTLTVGHANALGTGTGTIALNGGTIQSDSATARSFTNAVTIGGNFTVGGTGDMTFSNNGASNLGGNRTITVTTSGVNATFAQAFNGSTNVITKAGAGTLTLSGNNVHTGGTTLTGGTLVAFGTGASTTALGTGALTWGTTNTTLEFRRDGDMSVTNALATTVRSTTRTLVVSRVTSGPVNLAFTQQPSFDCGSVLNFQAGANVTGTPTITFSAGTNSSDSNNGDRTQSANSANGPITFNPTGVNLSIASIASSARTRAYFLSGTSTGNQITGVINNGSGTTIDKTGSGTWTLSGANLYSGSTTISGGKLTISAGNINATSGVSINGGEFNYNSGTALTKAVTFTGTGGTLSGTGTINALVTTGGSASVLSPGNSPSFQTYSAGLDVSAGTRFKMELSGDNTTANASDKIIVTGGSGLVAPVATNSGALVLDLYAWGFGPAIPNPGVPYTLVTYTASSNLDAGDVALGSLMSGLVLDSGYGTNGILVDFGGGGGAGSISVQFSAVPEPTSLALLGLGGMGLLARRRRRSSLKKVAV